MRFFVQTTPVGIAFGYSQSERPITGDVVEVASEAAAQDALGKHWSGSVWETVAAQPVRVLTLAEFQARLSRIELGALHRLSQSDTAAGNAALGLLESWRASQTVGLDDPDLTALLTAAETAGKLAPGRTAEILA